MLQAKQLQKLYQILNKKDDTLDQIEGLFLSNFNDSLSVFKASYSLSNLINLNLLTARQRIIAIFLLIENFKYEGIKKHPFGATILHISEKTTEPFERKMIAEIIVDMKRDKYSKSKIDALYDEEQSLLDPIEERPEIQIIRDQFCINLPKIPQTKKSEVFCIVNDSGAQRHIPQIQLDERTLTEGQLSHEAFNLGFMRPIPRFLDIDPSQFHWLSPGIIADVHWDNTSEIQKKLAKPKTLMRKAMESHLSKDECNQIDRVLENEPYSVLSLGVLPENLESLIKNNSYLVVGFLLKLSNYPIIGKYLQKMLSMEINFNLIDVVSRLVKACKVPDDFVKLFTLSMMKQTLQISKTQKDYQRLPRLLAKFISTFIKNKLLDLTNHEDQLAEFIKNFIEIDEVEILNKSIKKT